MNATKGQLERRQVLRRLYEQAVPAPRAAETSGLHSFTVYRWYKTWMAQDGDKAVHCECGRPLIHKGRCKFRDVQRRFYGRDGSPSVYDGPTLIGRAMSPDEAADFRVRVAHLI